MKIAEAVKLLQGCRWEVTAREVQVTFENNQREQVIEAIKLLDFPRRINSIPGRFYYAIKGARESDRAIVEIPTILESYGIDFEDLRKVTAWRQL